MTPALELCERKKMRDDTRAWRGGMDMILKMAKFYYLIGSIELYSAMFRVGWLRRCIDSRNRGANGDYRAFGISLERNAWWTSEKFV